MNMNERNYLKEYVDSIKRLKKECNDKGVTEEEFEKLYFDSLKLLEKENNESSVKHKYFNRKKKLLLFVISFVFTTFVAKCVYNHVMCNIHELIYPGLRLIRKISIPFISLFPALTELYQEPCLIYNPFFTIMDMDCWPCSMVNNVGQIYDPQPIHQQHASPFVYETKQEEVNMKIIKDLYLNNKEIFDKESTKIIMNNKFKVKLSELITNNEEDDHSLYVWKINNIDIARILRQKIPRAKIVPKFGQSTERFIIIDTSHNAFNIPDTECNFAFLLSLSGSRTVILNPAEECKHQCKSLKVELKESYLLWYNWWYWRPVIQQSNGNETFVGHVGSYC